MLAPFRKHELTQVEFEEYLSKYGLILTNESTMQGKVHEETATESKLLEILREYLNNDDCQEFDHNDFLHKLKENLPHIVELIKASLEDNSLSEHATNLSMMHSILIKHPLLLLEVYCKYTDQMPSHISYLVYDVSTHHTFSITSSEQSTVHLLVIANDRDVCMIKRLESGAAYSRRHLDNLLTHVNLQSCGK
jgi:hypothetical protein